MIDLSKDDETCLAETPSWTNEFNHDRFYCHPENEEILKNYAEIAGLASACDIQLIYDELKTAHRILDVGAGYGRAIEALFDLGYKGEIHALEKSENYCKRLAELFGNKITIYHDDVFAYSTDKPFDVLLSLWCGIGDFTPGEQLGYLRHLYDLLDDEGTLYLDTSTWCIQSVNTEYVNTNTEYLSEQFYLISEREYLAQGYIPTINEVKACAKCAGFRSIKVIRYKTDTYRERFLYTLIK